MDKPKTGDEVRVFSGALRRSPHQPQDGWPGKIVAVGRRYAKAEYVADGTWARVVEFDMATGNERGCTSSYGTVVKTPGMASRDRRLKEAKSVLKAHKVEFGFGCRLSLEQVEALAEVARTFGEG